MNDKMKPALIGGVVLGILSAIPFVNIPNVCCCAWAVVGGILAAHLYIKSSPTPVNMGDGAILGAIAGVVGAVINFIVGIPLQLVAGNAMMGILASIADSADPQQAAAIRQMAASGVSVGGAVVNALIFGVLFIIFATVGGVIGVAIFEKRKGGAGAPPPPPPPTYGGPGGV